MPRTGRREGVFRGRDWTNVRVGRLVVLERDTFDGRVWRWRCACDCGNETSVLSQSLALGERESSGGTRSCGCLGIARRRAATRTHGCSMRTTEYTIWNCMKQRCENPDNPAFKNYGARGIKVDPRWSASFEAFLADVGARPSLEHSLDRYPNNDGNYEPGNVRWATRREQALGRRVAVVLEYEGVKYTLTDLARRHGLNPSALKYRVLHKGMSVAEALALPSQRPLSRAEVRAKLAKEVA
jgi:hypothetical protein